LGAAAVLSEVMEIVEAKGWFDTTTPFEKTIYLSQGSAQCVLLSRNGRPECFIKFTNLMSLAVEAERSSRCFKRFPQHTPHFIGYARRPPLEVLATRALSFRPVTGQMMLVRRNRSAVCAGLERLFHRMHADAPQTDMHQRRHAWFDGMRQYFGVDAADSVAAIGLRRLDDALQTLAPMAQHGDLVLNNLGLRAGAELVVFDWEDYGAVELPGLDLFTLEIAIHTDLQSESPRGICCASDPVLDTQRLCEALGLPLGLYESLRLSYALTFRYMKRNYSAEVRARLDGLVERLALELGFGARHDG